MTKQKFKAIPYGKNSKNSKCQHDLDVCKTRARMNARKVIRQELETYVPDCTLELQWKSEDSDYETGSFLSFARNAIEYNKKRCYDYAEELLYKRLVDT